MSNELEELAKKYNTDKQMSDHGYTKFYYNNFKELKDKKLNILEIGVWSGASLQMWADFFSNSTVIGLDDLSSGSQFIKTKYDNDRIHFHNGSQFDSKCLDSLKSKYNSFDIIIDDGSHYSHHINFTFDSLWPTIVSGGWYVIEDLATSYPPYSEGGLKSRFNAENLTSVEYFKRFIDKIHRKQCDIDEMRISNQILFLKKK